MLRLAVLALLLVACGTSASEGRVGVAEPEPSRARAARMPAPARAREGLAVAANRACVGCHAEVAREWEGSLHHRADVEPAYRRAFAIEPFPFCRSCHAPEGEPTQVESVEVAELGVGCVTCHLLDEGRVLAVPAAEGGEERAPHPVAREPRFATAEACASCHEFRFPHPPGTRELMQSTVSEHAASTSASEPCAGCHMPEEGRRRGHAFVASRDAAFVKRAVAVRARRAGPTRVAIELVPQRPGHAFPTGDLFRRVEITAEAFGPDRMVLGSAERYLTRHFRIRPGGGRALVGDDRLRNDPVTLELDVGPEAAGRPIAWRVAYQRVAHPIGEDDTGAEIEGEIVLDEGTLEAM